MKKEFFPSWDLTIETARIEFRKSEKEAAAAFFHGSPVAYYLLKYSKHGDPQGYDFSWHPLDIELCINDIDDFDIDYGYKAKDEAEFDEIVGAISEWMQEAERKEHTLNSCLKLPDMPFRELFKRVF